MWLLIGQTAKTHYWDDEESVKFDFLSSTSEGEDIDEGTKTDIGLDDKGYRPTGTTIGIQNPTFFEAEEQEDASSFEGPEVDDSNNDPFLV